MVGEKKFRSTKELSVPSRIIEQVIGQTDAVKIIKKAARQRRHVLLIGEPGTGKSLLGLGLAELLPREKLVDIVAFANPNDENNPLIRVLPASQGRNMVIRIKTEAGGFFRPHNIIMLVLIVISLITPWWAFGHYSRVGGPLLGGLMFSAFFIGSIIFMGAAILFINLSKKAEGKGRAPKVIVDNYHKKQAPFFDATGAHAGALLGDVLHDPFQSGGLGTPAHDRIVAGMIHKAHMGVLFVDEIATLEPTTQQELLTALQEGKYSITGQSERSAGAMVRTEPVPCNFVLVAAGNAETLNHLHPALRSRIRGYGYEIYMKDTIEDTPENRQKIAQLVAQEVTKDKKIPHFSYDAVQTVITEARKRANRKGHLTLRLRELGGLIRAAGDLAVEEKSPLTERMHVLKARKIAQTLEQQIADKIIEHKKEYEVLTTEGMKVGRVNGLAVLGSGSAYSGIILPIEAEVTPGGEEREIIATGKLGDIAKEAVKNVSAIIKKHFGEDIRKKYDLYVQFLQTYEGVEGDSASIAVATAIISALKDVPVKQEYAMTGSLSVRGGVMPVGGVSSKVEAALEAGIKKVIVPKTNLKDIILDSDKLSKIEIIPVEKIGEVLKEALHWKGKEAVLKKVISA